MFFKPILSFSLVNASTAVAHSDAWRSVVSRIEEKLAEITRTKPGNGENIQVTVPFASNGSFLREGVKELGPGVLEAHLVSSWV